MNTTTPAYSVVAFLLGVACTFMAWPLNVLSQSELVDGSSLPSATSTVVTPATTTVSEQAVPASNVNRYGDTYKREPLVGGDTVYGDFVVGPGKVELELAPGESQTIEMTVSNRTGEAKRFSFTTEDTTAGLESTVELLGDEVGPYTLKDYISVPYPEFTLAHGERARIPVTVSLPADAEPGGRYGSILVSLTTKGRPAEQDGVTIPGSAVVSRVATLFFITTPGDLNREANLANFGTVNDQTFFTSGPIPFVIDYENTGTVHVSPYGTMRIENMLGEPVGSVELSPWFVMPESVRSREVEWNREFLLGRYTATVEINKGYVDEVQIQNFSFWVIPWQLVASVLAGLFVFFLLIRLILSRFEIKRK